MPRARSRTACSGSNLLVVNDEDVQSTHVCKHDGCGKNFKDRAHLAIHSLTHTDVKPFLCTVCSKSFRQRVHLETHHRIHTGKKPYACDHADCKKAFTQHTHLQIHRRTHTGEKQYACDYAGCNKAFADKRDLTKHRRIHTGERPHVCQFDACGKSFVGVGALKSHQRQHTGEKPFACTFTGCGQTFAHKCALVVHTRGHTGERPYACHTDGCAATFAQHAHLQTHLKAKHSPEGQQRQKKQEQQVARVLAKAGVAFKREHVVDFRCIEANPPGSSRSASFARIDFVLDLHGHVVFLEVDEQQHKFGYGAVSCDMKRMATIVESLAIEGNTLPVVFIRYNPHAYKVDGVNVKMMRADREKAMVQMLRDPASALWDGRPLSVQYMYYDSNAGYPDVMRDPSYNAEVAACCLPAVV